MVIRPEGHPNAARNCSMLLSRRWRRSSGRGKPQRRRHHPTRGRRRHRRGRRAAARRCPHRQREPLGRRRRRRGRVSAVCRRGTRGARVPGRVVGARRRRAGRVAARDSRRVAPRGFRGRPNVIGWIPSSDPPDGLRAAVILNSHADTVGPGEATSWNHPPLSAHLEDGNISGLGVADAKGSLFTFIGAVRALRHAGFGCSAAR